MMKTVLSIVQQSLRRMNVPAPSSLYGTTDQGNLQLISIMYEVLEELRQSGVFPQQKRTYPFSTTSGLASYPLPLDFYSLLPGTQWNQDEDRPLIGPVEDSLFTLYTQGTASSTTNFTGRIFGPDENPNSDGGQFQVNPTPSATVNLYFEYVSRNTLMPKNWAPSTVFAAGAYCNSNGNIYQTTAGGTTSTDPPTGTTTHDDGGVTDWAFFRGPYETLTADTDLAIFDYDLISLGFRSKYMEEHGGDFQMASAEYHTKIERARTRYYGIRKGSFSRRKSRRRYVVPTTGWSL